MGYKILQILLKGFLHISFKCERIGVENIPSDGGAIVALNHRSYWDVVFAGSFLKRPLRYMAKSGLFENPLFGWLITKLGAFPVQRGKGDVGAIKSALKILKGGDVMLIFPEGKRVFGGEHTKAKSGVALISIMARVPVIPVCISGDYKFRHKITVNIGTPIEFSEYYTKKPDGEELQKIADNVLETIYNLEV